ncbi:hypothetical protein IWQ56_006969, partial [Coemansia nantahalensis]
MAVYTLYCLRPHLLLATPLGLAIAYILHGFYRWEAGRSTGADAAATARAPTQPPRAASPAGRSPGTGMFGFGQATRVSAAAAVVVSPTSTHSSSASSLRQDTAPQSMSRRPTRRGQALKRRHSAAQGPTHAQAAAPDAGTAAPDVAPGTGAPSAGMRRRSDDSTADGHAARSSHAAAAGSWVDAGALLGAASFGSAQYTQNVHTTQTLTGTYVGAYDWVAAHHHLVDWSRPAEAQRILAACVCAQAAVLVAAYIVAPHVLFLAGGNLGMLAMSPHVRAFAKVYGAELALDACEWAAGCWAGAQQRAARAAACRWLPAAIRRRNDGGSGVAAQESDGDDDDEAGGSGFRTPPALPSLASTAGSSTSTLARR